MELTLLVYLFMGFAFGFIATYIIHLGWQADTDAEIRYWRNTALANDKNIVEWASKYESQKAKADYWEKQYIAARGDS